MQGCVEGGVVELAGGKKWKREREERTNKRIEKWQPNLIYLAFVVGLPRTSRSRSLVNLPSSNALSNALSLPSPRRLPPPRSRHRRCRVPPSLLLLLLLLLQPLHLHNSLRSLSLLRPRQKTLRRSLLLRHRSRLLHSGDSAGKNDGGSLKFQDGVLGGVLGRGRLVGED